MKKPLSYEVGYCRPPKRTQWQKGQCGNPKRIRKQNPKPVLDMIDEFFASEVPVTENGISQRRSAFEIIFLQLFNKAMAGNTRALKVLTKYSDFAASRDSTGGMRIELIDDENETKPKESGEKNG
jgi:Family of unknown function (DUF5681)